MKELIMLMKNDKLMVEQFFLDSMNATANRSTHKTLQMIYSEKINLHDIIFIKGFAIFNE